MSAREMSLAPHQGPHANSHLEPTAPSVDLDVRGSKLDEKGQITTKKVAFFFLTAATYILSIPLAPIILIPRAVSYVHNYDLNTGIRKARLEKFREGLDAVGGYKMTRVFLKKQCYDLLNKKPTDLTKKEIIDINKFINLTFEIREAILSKSDPDEIRSLIDKAMGTSIYQRLKDTNHPSVEFLQILAVEELSTDGKPALIEYGRQEIGQLPEDKNTFSWGELANKLDVPAKGNGLTNFQKRKIFTIFWAMSHPFEVLNALKSKWFPLEYDSNHNNPIFSNGFDFKMIINGETKIMSFHYTPGKTGNKLFEHGVLPWLKKHGAQIVHFEHEDPKSKGEFERIQKQLEMAASSNGTMKTVPLNFNEIRNFTEGRELNTKNEKTQRTTQIAQAIGNKNVNEFFEMYKASHNPLDAELRLAINTAKKVFNRLLQNHESSAYWDELAATEKGKQRLAKMMILAVHAIYSVGVVIDSLKKVQSEEKIAKKYPQTNRDLVKNHVSGSCKQDIDRGPMENIALQLFFSLLNSDGNLSRNEVYAISGGVIGRARIAEGRLPLLGRYQILSDLLHFVNDTAGQNIVKTALEEGYKDAIPTPAKDAILTPAEMPNNDFEEVSDSSDTDSWSDLRHTPGLPSPGSSPLSRGTTPNFVLSKVPPKREASPLSKISRNPYDSD